MGVSKEWAWWGGPGEGVTRDDWARHILDEVVLPAMQLRLASDAESSEVVKERGLACLGWLARALAMQGSSLFQVWSHPFPTRISLFLFRKISCMLTV